MDNNKLPVNIGTTITEYLQKAMPDVPEEILTIALLTKIAQVASLNRSRIKSNLIVGGDGTMQPTIYSIFFASSGTGKDRLVNTFDFEILKDVKQKFSGRYRNQAQQILEEALSDTEDTSKSEAKEVKDQNTIHDYRWHLNHGTYEGLLAMATSIERAGCGCIFYQHSEFIDLLQRHDENAMLMIDSLKDLYDGRISSKIIKSDKKHIEVTKCPTVMLAFSAIEGVEDERTREKIFELFARGFARRSFVVLENLSTKPKPVDTVEELDELTKASAKALSYIQNLFMLLYMETSKGRVYEFTKEADYLLATYRLENSKKVNIDGIVGKVLNPERVGRAWKAMQVAGLVAMFEHPNDLTVSRDDVEFAIYITELFGSHIESFFQELTSPAEDKLRHYLLDNRGKRLTKMDLREQNFVHANRFSSWLAEAISLIEPQLGILGYELETSFEGKSTYYYLTDRWQPPEGDTESEEKIIEKVKNDGKKDTERLKRSLTNEELIVEYEQSNDDNIITDPF